MSVVEKMTGLTRRRIRYYEKLGLLVPARTPGNRRLYAPANVRRLAEIKRLLEEGLDLRAIAALAASGRWLPAESEAAARARGLEIRDLERYEDARARLLGQGPAGSLDRLYPGDAGRLLGPGRPVARPGRNQTRQER